ncbi:preprotein translocase subunit SecE [Eubacteriales bacterium OttesenSCG-928-N13]|nr:preprotein translocase subunit SecE [Eubacteriales bacterium OttesenSCG-928-N13]
MANTNADNKAKSDKKPNVFVRLIKRIGNAFKDTYAELHKVTWPSRQDLINYSVVVLVFMVFMGVVIGLFDFGASHLIRLIVGGTAA